MTKFWLIPLISLLMFIAACGGKQEVKLSEEFDPEKSFIQANKYVEEKDYENARALLLEIKNRDQTKNYAPIAQLKIADTYVRDEEPELAVTAYRKFIELYPDHKYAAYAQFQIANIYFNQIESAERGYGGAAKAMAEFEKLKRDYPRNPYRDVIELRIEKCRNVIADYELLVGKFYMKKGSYHSAISRFETVLKKFPDYKAEADVLYNLGIAYKKVGEPFKAEDMFKKVLEKYPSLPITKDAEKELAALDPILKLMKP